MPNIKLEFQGKKVDAKPLAASTNDYEISKSFDFSSYRTESTLVSEQVDEETILQLTTEDGFEWIGKYDDLLAINNKTESDRSEEGAVKLPDYLMPRNSDRSFQKVIKNKSLDFINGKLAAGTAKALGKLIDAKVMTNQGLFSLDKTFNLQPLGKINPEEKYLLFIHGTISTTEGSFGAFKNEEWHKIYSNYEGRILAFNHNTISDSPYCNAIDLLKALPEKVNLDIISSSRGGLVADIVARCDSRITQKGFSSEEITLMKNDFGNMAAEMEKIVSLTQQKDILVHKIIRVACPASGTILLSKRLDHFLNFLLNAFQQALGSKANLIYEAVKTFLLDVIKARHKTEAFPGLWSMVPDSLFQKINNNDFELPSALVSITGDAEIGRSFWNSLKVILTNLYYLQANDFVVNTKAMSRGLKNRAALYKYFCNLMK